MASSRGMRQLRARRSRVVPANSSGLDLWWAPSTSRLAPTPSAWLAMVADGWPLATRSSASGTPRASKRSRSGCRSGSPSCTCSRVRRASYWRASWAARCRARSASGVRSWAMTMCMVEPLRLPFRVDSLAEAAPCGLLWISSQRRTTQFGHMSLQGQPVGVGRQRLAGHQGDARPDAAERPACRVTAEETAPQPLQRQGDHRHRRLAQDQLDAALELVHLTGGGQLALGEDAHHFAGLQVGLDAREGLFVDLAVLVLGGDGHRAGGAEHEVEHRQVVDAVVGDEAYRAADGAAEQQGVDEGDVVADQQHRPLVGDNLQVAMLDPVQGVGEQPDDEA